jgi:hypothetical protein
MEFIFSKRWDQSHRIFQKFVEYFTGKNLDLVSLPRISAVDCFLYPELHEESVIIITAHRILHRICFSAGIYNFSFSRYFNQNHEKTPKNLTNVITLAKYRGKILRIFTKFSKKINNLSTNNYKINLVLFKKVSKYAILKKIFNNFKKEIRFNKIDYFKFYPYFFQNGTSKNILSIQVKNSKKKNLVINDVLEQKIFFLSLFLFKLKREINIKHFKTKKFISSEEIKNYAPTFLCSYEKIYSNCQLNIGFFLKFKKVYRLFIIFASRKFKKLISLNSIDKFLFPIKKQLFFENRHNKYFAKFNNITKIKQYKNFKKFFFILKIMEQKTLMFYL